MEPRTVALLVSREIAPKVRPLDTIGDERALWFEVEVVGNDADTEAQTRTLLGLAVYANPPNHLDAERRGFWHTRWLEWQTLRGDPRYCQCPAIFLGDFNLHNPDLTSKDAELARPIDRELWQLLIGHHGFNLAVLNPPEQPTHVSGSTLDSVLVTAEWQLDFARIDLQDVLLVSDHYPVVALSPTERVLTTNIQKKATARWDGGDHWNLALDGVACSLRCVADLAVFLASWTQMLNWVKTGSHRRLRQRILDTIVWWREVLMAIAGHLAGLARITWTSPQPARSENVQWLAKFFDTVQTADPDGRPHQSIINEQLFLPSFV